MYYIPHLHRFELKLKKLPKWVKSLFIILPTLFVIVIFYFMGNTTFYQNKFSKKIAQIQQKQSQPINMLEIMKALERYSIENAIRILSQKEENKILSIGFHVSKEKVIPLMNFLESFHDFSHIEMLKINDMKGYYHIDIKLSFLHYYKKKKYVAKKDIKKDFENIRVSAIVGNYILLNDVWHINKSVVKGYRLEIIDANTIQLHSSHQEYFFKVYNETQ